MNEATQVNQGFNTEFNGAAMKAALEAATVTELNAQSRMPAQEAEDFVGHKLSEPGPTPEWLKNLPVESATMEFQSKVVQTEADINP